MCFATVQTTEEPTFRHPPSLTSVTRPSTLAVRPWEARPAGGSLVSGWPWGSSPARLPGGAGNRPDQCRGGGEPGWDLVQDGVVAGQVA